MVCSAGPRDRPYEEQHRSVVIAVVLEGSFQYRSARGSALMSPGALLVDGCGQPFECAHDYSTGDRCIAFHYSPEYFERAGASVAFPVNRIPPATVLAPWITEARLLTEAPELVAAEELACGLAGAVLDVVGVSGTGHQPPSAADERRISTALRFIEAHIAGPLSLDRLASVAKMSQFHFLRTFRRVTGITPHQYILRARLREAACRLRACRDEVTGIALDSGFQDLSTFYHAFRAEFGMTPLQFKDASVKRWQRGTCARSLLPPAAAPACSHLFRDGQ